jgi:DNA-binding SARP family transcriptional activator
MLTIRLLGELEVLRDGEKAMLPPSKKTRALLAYLVGTGRPHRRERLCATFWEVPNDPRGALRWSVSRLRAIVDSPDKRCIIADRESVGVDVTGVDVDLAAVRRAASEGFENLPTESLQEIAGLFRGEFLEGLDLPGQHDFQSWCIAEREDLRRLQVEILSKLAARLEAQPEAAAQVVRQLVQIDPYSEDARIGLLRLLLACGRHQEAESHFETAERLFREVDDEAPYRLRRAWRDLLRRREGSTTAPIAPAAAEPPAAAPPPMPDRGGLVGRAEELNQLRQTLDAISRLYRAKAVTVLGEPGIGKSRLMSELAADARDRGVKLLMGCCYDAELGSAYVPWIEALGGLPRQSEAASADSGREQLFAAIAAEVLKGTSPILIVLEDVHWADEASAALLHHVMRAGRNHPLMAVLTAREGELPDNRAISAVLRSLRHDGAIEDLRLNPLAPGDVGALIGGTQSEADLGRIAALSGGNPLYAIELARNLAENPDGLPLSLRELVRGRVERFPPAVAELLRWASVLGPQIDIEQLRKIMPTEMEEFMTALERLERYGMLAPIETGEAAGGYVFSHDLVRRAIYTGLSEPRRRLMHHRIAHALVDLPGGKEALALEIARHAAAGGDAGMAAKACVSAGRRCLRIFANSQAMALVRSGLHYAENLPEAERVQRTIELLEIELGVSRPDDVAQLNERIEQLAGLALDHDLPDHARRAYTLLANLRWQEGAWSDAKRDMLRAELVSRSVEGRQRVHALAEASRCLAMLERDLPMAEAMVMEADALANRLSVEPNAIADATGLLRFYCGAFDEAAELFLRARTLARQDGDKHSEFLALEHLATLELARGRLEETLSISRELLDLAEKMRHGSELPFASALNALCRCALGDEAAMPDFDRAIEALRLADTKQRLAMIAMAAANHCLASEQQERGMRLAEEALAAATLLSRPSDMALALAILARLSAVAGAAHKRRAYLGRLGAMELATLSATAREAVEAVMSGPTRKKLGKV